MFLPAFSNRARTGPDRTIPYSVAAACMAALALFLAWPGVSAGEWMEGPDGVLSQIEQEDEKRRVSPGARVLRAYAHWKQMLKEEHGLSFGVQYLGLYQGRDGSRSASGDKGAAGGVFRFNGSYEVFRGSGGDEGWLEWRLENRHGVGGLPMPGEWPGMAFNPADGYQPFDTDLTVFSWTRVFSGRWGYSLGRLSYSSYLDAGYYQSLFGSFLNAAFIASPAVASTGAGALGFVVKGLVSPHLVAGLQVHDANATSGRFSLDTLKENEYLKAVELGWLQDPQGQGEGMVLLTAWHRDALEKRGIEAGAGVALNTTLVAGDFVPFVHLAVNDGGGGVAGRRAVSAGTEYRTGTPVTWALGLGWSEPVGAPDRGGDHVMEASCRVDILAGFEVMLDIQRLGHVSGTGQRELEWIGSLRVNMNI